MKKNKCEKCNIIFPSLDKHHIHSLSKGGKDVEWNRCHICPLCHRLVHLGLIVFEGRYRTTKGNTLIFRNKGEESITGMPDPPVWIITKEESS